MNPAQARQLIKDTFTQSFDRDRFGRFAANLFNHVDGEKKGAMAVPDAFAAHVKSCQRLAGYSDPAGELLDVLIVNVSEDYKIERTRTALRDFVAHKLKRGDNYKEAALVAFVPPDARRWRLSYVRMQYETVRDPKTGVIKPEERPTPARRFSYLVGEDESCHTAQTRFLGLLQVTTVDPTLAQIEEAFSVEAVTKEFFGKYAELFGDINAALEKLVAKDKTLRDEFKAKGVKTVDFAKKLMGQIVFLYFLQKKGWLGVEKSKDWGAGPRDFLRCMARGEYGKYDNFFNDILEPLFYDTLATDRGHDAWCNRFKCRIPFLNGGLFEPLADYNWKKTDVILPNRLFTNDDPVEEGIIGTGVLDVFDRYNFTVNEAEPLEKEVAIDPEMLGKVFENLIEENRRKGLGAFYTPREIVHYMCQESLINYLDAKMNRPEKPIGARAGKPDPQMTLCVDSSQPAVVPVGQQEFTDTTERILVPRKELEEWVRQSDQFAHYAGAIAAGTKGEHYPKPASSIRKYASEIDRLLRDITVCDPAVGSGAFPVGMMTEIVRARAALTPYFKDIGDRTPYHFKRHAIQNCLYGVDIDSGAVDIAKLRLWLSLVVDEEDVKQVKPLPNLDYKIVVGNSLLGVEKNLFNHEAFRRLETLKPRFFDQTDPTQKAVLRRQINEIIHELTNGNETFDFEIFFSEVFHARKGFDVVIANPPYVFGGNKGITQEDKDAYKNLYVSGAMKINLFALFVERGSQVIRKHGALIYILPNTLLRVTSYANTRRFIIENLCVHKVIDLDVGVFDTVTASTVVISLLNGKPGRTWAVTVQRGCEDVCPVKVLQSDWTKKGYILDIFSQDEDRVLFDKLARDSILLGDLCSRLRFGVVISGNFDEVVSETKHSLKWKPFLEGNEIGTFVTKYGGRYLRYEKDLLHRSRTPDIFETRKIMIQRITGGETPLKATLDDKKFYNKESILNLILSTDSYSYEYILGILNSRLANWFYKRRFTNSSKLTVNLSKEYVGQIPIKRLSKSDQKPLEHLVDRILAAKKNDPSADTTALEREIDQIVYRLYNLTPDEIAQIEGALANTRRVGDGVNEAHDE